MSGSSSSPRSLAMHVCATFYYAGAEGEVPRRVRIGSSIVRLIMAHGYMLAGMGSCVCVRKLLRRHSFREGLQATVHALSKGATTTVERLAELIREKG